MAQDISREQVGPRAHHQIQSDRRHRQEPTRLNRRSQSTGPRNTPLWCTQCQGTAWSARRGSGHEHPGRGSSSTTPRSGVILYRRRSFAATVAGHGTVAAPLGGTIGAAHCTVALHLIFHVHGKYGRKACEGRDTVLLEGFDGFSDKARIGIQNCKAPILRQRLRGCLRRVPHALFTLKI